MTAVDGDHRAGKLKPLAWDGSKDDGAALMDFVRWAHAELGEGGDGSSESEPRVTVEDKLKGEPDAVKEAGLRILGVDLFMNAHPKGKGVRYTNYGNMGYAMPDVSFEDGAVSQMLKSTPEELLANNFDGGSVAGLAFYNASLALTEKFDDFMRRWSAEAQYKSPDAAQESLERQEEDGEDDLVTSLARQAAIEATEHFGKKYYDDPSQGSAAVAAQTIRGFSVRPETFMTGDESNNFDGAMPHFSTLYTAENLAAVARWQAEAQIAQAREEARALGEAAKLNAERVLGF